MVPMVMLATLVGCGGGEDDTGLEGPVGTLHIAEPADGSWTDEGEVVHLLAQASTSTGDPLSIEGLTWTAGEWSVEGNDLDVTDLPAGELTLVASGQARGQQLSDEVTIYVYAVSGGR